MYEIEKKYHITKEEYETVLPAKLEEMQFMLKSKGISENRYWILPGNDTFRISRIEREDNESNPFVTCTYKTIGDNGQRLEQECHVPEFILENLQKIEPVSLYFKRDRKTYYLAMTEGWRDKSYIIPGVTVCLDRILEPLPMLGYFMEIEIMQGNSKFYGLVKGIIDSFAKELGVTDRRTKVSYYKMCHDAQIFKA